MLSISGHEPSEIEACGGACAYAGKKSHAPLWAIPTVVVWTVTTVVDGNPICTAHLSKELAYREAVARLQYVESLDAIQNRLLIDALQVALKNNNFYFLHKCMQSLAIRTSAIQLSQHQLVELMPNPVANDAQIANVLADHEDPQILTASS